MSNETIPAIPVLATQINDSDLFEKADGLAGGQSQRVPASLFKSYLANAAQIYSNYFGAAIQVGASAGLTTASVAGMAQLSLWVPGSTTNFSSLLTAIGVVTGTSTNGTLSAFVPAAGTYTFTNTSSGSGDAAFPVNGQILVY